MAETTESKVLDIVANIIKNQDNNTSQSKCETNNSEDIEKKPKTAPVRGIPKSGRFWKSQKEKFSTINKTKGLRQTFQKKTELRLELKRVKEMSKQKVEELKQKELERKERRRQNILRAEENKRKAEVVQVITNTAKLKRMRKKQLRFIEKRDTNKQAEAKK